MKIEISKGTLLQGLQAVQNVVSVRTTLPILSNVLVQADKQGLMLTTTDLDVSVQCRIEAKVHKTGATTLPVRRLSSIVRELPESEIEIEVDDKDTASVKCGSSFYRIMGLSEEEFPPVAKAEGKHVYVVEQSRFQDMLRKTAYAASTDETRFVLNGVLLSFKGGNLVMVATDGRRLAMVEHEVEFPPEAELDMVLPAKVASELMHTLGEKGEINISAREGRVMFEFGNITVTSKLIDAVYPNYRQVIPASCEQRVMVERETLLTALKRVSLVMTDKSAATRLTFGKNKLVVSLTAADVGEARETLPIKYAGPEITVAFNAEFMMDPLRNLDSDEISIELTDELSPGLIRCETPFVYVLMPMRIA